MRWLLWNLRTYWQWNGKPWCGFYRINLPAVCRMKNDESDFMEFTCLLCQLMENPKMGFPEFMYQLSTEWRTMRWLWFCRIYLPSGSEMKNNEVAFIELPAYCQWSEKQSGGFYRIYLPVNCGMKNHTVGFRVFPFVVSGMKNYKVGFVKVICL